MYLHPKKINENFIFYYNRFKNKIYAYFLYRVNFDRKTAEDLTSEVFLKAFKNFSGFDGARSFQSWVYSISRHHLINYYKTSKRQVSLTEAINLPAKSDSAVENHLELERAVKAINSLGAGYQELLLMRYLEGLTNGEIASILGKEEGAVRAQISRGRAQLKKILKK